MSQIHDLIGKLVNRADEEFSTSKTAHGLHQIKVAAQALGRSEAFLEAARLVAEDFRIVMRRTNAQSRKEVPQFSEEDFKGIKPT